MSAGVQPQQGLASPTLNPSGVPILPFDSPVDLTSPVLALAFVNREDQAYTLAYLNIYNKQPGVKPFLVTSGQTFGSGKTEMGRRAVACFRSNAGAQQRIAKILPLSVQDI